MFWYEDEIKQLELKPVIIAGDKKRVVFYGSSSIRLWGTLETDFQEFNVTNQGFGGSTLAACCWFFNRVVPRHRADIIVLYAGDNDLGDNRHPEEVFLFFKNMMALIKDGCGDIPVAFLSVKHTIARMHLYNSIEFTNKIIREEIAQSHPKCKFVDIANAMLVDGSIDPSLYEPDGLHLSGKGYKIWADEVKSQFLNQFAATS